MYLCYTTRKKDDKVHRLWGSVRSVRVGRPVIQQTAAHLGELAEPGATQTRTFLAPAPNERSRRFGDVYLAFATVRGTTAIGQRTSPVGEDSGGSWRGSASPRANCTLPRIGIGAPRSPTFDVLNAPSRRRVDARTPASQRFSSTNVNRCKKTSCSPGTHVSGVSNRPRNLLVELRDIFRPIVKIGL